MHQENLPISPARNILNPCVAVLFRRETCANQSEQIPSFSGEVWEPQTLFPSVYMKPWNQFSTIFTYFSISIFQETFFSDVKEK